MLDGENSRDRLAVLTDREAAISSAKSEGCTAKGAMAAKELSRGQWAILGRVSEIPLKLAPAND